MTEDKNIDQLDASFRRKLKERANEILNERETLIKTLLNELTKLLALDIEPSTHFAAEPSYSESDEFAIAQPHRRDLYYQVSKVGFCEDCSNEAEVFPTNQGRYLCESCIELASSNRGFQNRNGVYRAAILDRVKAKKSMKNRVLVSILKNTWQGIRGNNGVPRLHSKLALEHIPQKIRIHLLAKRVLERLLLDNDYQKIQAKQKRSLGELKLHARQYLSAIHLQQPYSALRSSLQNQGSIDEQCFPENQTCRLLGGGRKIVDDRSAFDVPGHAQLRKSNHNLH
jgi:hypothetical protein